MIIIKASRHGGLYDGKGIFFKVSGKVKLDYTSIRNNYAIACMIRLKNITLIINSYAYYYHIINVLFFLSYQYKFTIVYANSIPIDKNNSDYTIIVLISALVIFIIFINTNLL